MKNFIFYCILDLKNYKSFYASDFHDKNYMLNNFSGGFAFYENLRSLSEIFHGKKVLQ